jgi:hypothetical protein
MQTADPETRGKVLVPPVQTTRESNVNTTDPVGTPPLGTVETVAVKFTGWPDTAGLADEVTAVLVGVGLADDAELIRPVVSTPTDTADRIIAKVSGRKNPMRSTLRVVTA